MPASTSGVVLTVLAVVLGGDAAGPVGKGLAGDGLAIDKGLLDGLHPGDRGAVHYVLTVGAEERRIPAGEAVVTAVAPRRSRIDVTADRPVRPGYRVTFELPPDRLSAVELVAAAGRYLQQAERERVIEEVVEKWVLGDDEETRRQVMAALSSRPEPATPRSEAAPRSLDSAASGRSAGDDIVVATSPPGMLLVPAGTYSIGVPPSVAGFYNQTPRFDTFLEAFWIDAAPVRVGEVGEGPPTGSPEVRQRPSPHRRDPSTAPPAAAPLGMTVAAPPAAAPLGTTRSARRLTGVTYAEAAAFCRRLGKRLPTELEWEAAVTTADTTIDPGEESEGEEDDLRLLTPILEWTASWYRPYPGNPVSESEYGERYRVLRGAGARELPSPHRRRFMAPDARHPEVGFRCVLDP